jgi:hypothetical protein
MVRYLDCFFFFSSFDNLFFFPHSLATSVQNSTSPMEGKKWIIGRIFSSFCPKFLIVINSTTCSVLRSASLVTTESDPVSVASVRYVVMSCSATPTKYRRLSLAKTFTNTSIASCCLVFTLKNMLNLQN